MSDLILERLKEAVDDESNQKAVFSLFTYSGHVLSGRVTGFGETVTLTAERERAEVPASQIEAFSVRRP